MQTIIASAPSVDNVEDNWGTRFDQAQRSFRERTRKPLSQGTNARLEKQIAEGDARIAAAVAKHEENVAELDEALAESGDVDFSNDPAWDDRWTIQAPAVPTVAELLRGVPMYGHSGRTRAASDYQVASAWESGWSLGESGYEAIQVAPPEHMSGREAQAFVDGVEAGASDRWEEYAEFLEVEAERAAAMTDPLREMNEAELAAAGSVVGHMA